VDEDKVLAARSIRTGSATASVPLAFTLDDLSPQEQFRRLGDRQSAPLDIMRGLLAYQASSLQSAHDFFERSACPIGMVLAEKSRALLAQEKQDEEGTRTTTESGDDSARAFRKLVVDAGLNVGANSRMISDLRAADISPTEAVNLRNNAIAFKRSHGDSDVARRYNRFLDALSEVQASAWREPPDFDISVKKQKDTRYDGTDYDNKSQRFQLNVKITNREWDKDFTGLKAELYAFGQGVTSSDYVLLDTADATFDLPREGEYEFHGGMVSLQFDDNMYAQYGTKYYGYTVVIRDAHDRIVCTKASRTRLGENLEKYRNKRKWTRFDRDFNASSGGSSHPFM
jgi:hypothetical protein